MDENKKTLDERRAALSQQGQVWNLATEAIKFEKPSPLFDQPLEITIQMLRGLRMVDETIVVYGEINEKNDSKNES